MNPATRCHATDRLRTGWRWCSACSRGYAGWATGIIASLGFMGESNGGLIHEVYADPVARQAHRDAGLVFKDSMVSVFIEGTFQGSGVLIGDGSCVLMTYHQPTVVGAASRPMNKLIQVKRGANYLTDPGETIGVLDFVIHPEATAPAAVQVDLAIAKLARKPANAVPLPVATTPPQIGDMVKLVGFGRPATYSGFLPVSGELLGGQAPVIALPSGGGGVITTQFRVISNISLNYGGTTGDSGGAVIKADGTLAGTIRSGTSPNFSQSTYSGNLSNHTAWISEQLAYFAVIPPQTPPVLGSRAAANQQITLFYNEVPLVQTGGRWVLEKSADTAAWTKFSEAIQAEFSGNGWMTVPASATREFYRLTWEPAAAP